MGRLPCKGTIATSRGRIWTHVTGTLYTRWLVVSNSGRRPLLRSEPLRHAVRENGATVKLAITFFGAVA